MIMVNVRNAKSYRERKKLANAARKGNIKRSGKYREKGRGGLSET